MCLNYLTRLLRERRTRSADFCGCHEVLEALEEDDPLQPTLRTFELELLEQLGYGVDFSAQGQPLDDSAQYRFEAQSGFHAVQGPSSQGTRQYSGRF